MSEPGRTVWARGRGTGPSHSSGPPILFVHAWSQGHLFWKRQVAPGTMIGPGLPDHLEGATAEDLPTNIRTMREFLRAMPARPLPDAVLWHRPERLSPTQEGAGNSFPRVRGVERPRHGYFLDHLLDAYPTFIIGLGLELSPHMLLPVGLGIVIGNLRRLAALEPPGRSGRPRGSGSAA